MGTDITGSSCMMKHTRQRHPMKMTPVCIACDLALVYGFDMLDMISV